MRVNNIPKKHAIIPVAIFRLNFSLRQIMEIGTRKNGAEELSITTVAGVLQVNAATKVNIDAPRAKPLDQIISRSNLDRRSTLNLPVDAANPTAIMAIRHTRIAEAGIGLRWLTTVSITITPIAHVTLVPKVKIKVLKLNLGRVLFVL